MHAVKRLSHSLPFSQCLFISLVRSTQFWIPRRNNYIKAGDAKEISVPLPYGQIAGKLQFPVLVNNEILLLINISVQACCSSPYYGRVYLLQMI